MTLKVKVKNEWEKNYQGLWNFFPDRHLAQIGIWMMREYENFPSQGIDGTGIDGWGTIKPKPYCDRLLGGFMLSSVILFRRVL
jgi:hypothetical protein